MKDGGGGGGGGVVQAIYVKKSWSALSDRQSYNCNSRLQFINIFTC